MRVRLKRKETVKKEAGRIKKLRRKQQKFITRERKGRLEKTLGE